MHKLRPDHRSCAFTTHIMATASTEESLYDVLGVSREATASQIKRAYHKQALLSHPDKNPGDAVAEARFNRVAVAYAVLSDPEKRTRYDRGGGNERELYEGFNLGRASEQLSQELGQALMQQWAPGLTVRGTLIWDGSIVDITIHPDGSTDEHEQPSRVGALFRYVHTTTDWPNGNRARHIRFSTTLGTALAGVLVPNAVARMPTVGHMLTTAVSWLPTALMALLAIAADKRFFRPRITNPGAIPDVLADAFRVVEPRR